MSTDYTRECIMVRDNKDLLMFLALLFFTMIMMLVMMISRACGACFNVCFVKTPLPETDEKYD